MIRLPLILVAFLFLAVNTRAADPVVFSYAGDKTPAESPYGSWFTTLGPGHPTGQYFLDTTWSSDGNVLRMNTVHPNDFAGSTSQGIWFGRTDNYNDPSVGLNLALTTAGNTVETRLALAPNSSEWSLYWYDSSSRGAAFYLLTNGFSYYLDGVERFQPLSDMTGFHTYGSHIYNGEVSYYLDGMLLDRGQALNGPANFLLLGDGSAGSVSGYGSLLVDYMNITVNAGPAPVPEPSTSCLLTVAVMLRIGARRILNRSRR
jgi:hypothetical protein